MRGPSLTLVWTAPVVLAAILMPRGASGADGHERANALYRQGAEAARRGDSREAYAAFAESYKLWPRGATLGNVGWAEVESGRILEGLRHLREAVRAADLDDQRRAVVQSNLDEVAAKVGQLALRVDDHARVRIDGEPLHEAAPGAAPIDVLPGPHALEATMGTQTVRAEVQARAGTVVSVDLRGPTESAAVPAPRPPSMSVPSGSSEREDPARSGPRAATWWTTPHTVGVALGTVALVGAGMGLSFAIASQGAADDARSLRESLGQGACLEGGQAAACGRLKAQLGAVDTDSAAARASFVVGGAAAVGAAAAFLFWGPKAAPRTGALEWTVGPNAVGVRGTF